MVLDVCDTATIDTIATTATTATTATAASLTIVATTAVGDDADAECLFYQHTSCGIPAF